MFPQLWPKRGQAFGHPPIATEFRVRHRSSPCGICDGESGTGAWYCHDLQFSLIIIIIIVEAGLHRYHRAENTTMVWPRQKDARGENTKINYGLDTMGEKEKRTSK